MKACTSSSFGVPNGSLRAGIDTFAVHHQSAGRGVRGSSEISRQSLTSVLGNRVWLGLQHGASDGCGDGREMFTFSSYTHTSAAVRNASGITSNQKQGLQLRKPPRSRLPGKVSLGAFIPAAKLVWIADTGLVLSLSRSVTSGEAKSTRPLYTLERSSLDCFTIDFTINIKIET